VPRPESTILDALYHGHVDQARQLAAASPRLTIWEAAALGADAEVDSLLREDPALVNAWAPDGHTPLGLAAFFAADSTVRLLLERGADVHAAARNPIQVQPLHAAIAAGHVDTARLLVEHGADVNARQQAGFTPLMGAAAAGEADLVHLLLGRGADVSAVSDDGRTAAAVARERGHDTIAAHLARVAASDRSAAPP
jgi:uncharacterized protein